MADVNFKDFIDALTADTSPESTDLVYVRTSVGNRKMTVQNLFKAPSLMVSEGRDGGDVGGYLMDGVDDYITGTFTEKLNSVSFFANLSTASKTILNFGTNMTIGIDATPAITLGSAITNATVYVNGIATTTFTLNAWNHITVVFDEITATTLEIGKNSTTYLAGKVALFRFWNRALTAAEALALYNNGRPDLYELLYESRFGGLRYQSNFVADTNSWAGTRTTLTANIDGVSDGVTSYDNVLRAYASADNSTHRYGKALNDVNGKRAIIKFKVYLPSANTNVGGFGLTQSGNTTLTIHSLTCKKVSDNSNYGTVTGHNITNCKGYWLQVVADVTYNFTASNNLQLLMYQGTGTTITFAGAGADTDDLIYVYDWTTTVLGCVAEYLPHNAGRLGWLDSSGNHLSGQTSGSPLSLNAEKRPAHYRDIRKAIVANTDTALTNIVPKGYKIVSIRAVGSDSLTAVKIGTSSAGEQIVASTTTSSTTPKLLTLAATANDAYSESADVTLYARHDTSASGKTMDLIFHFEKVGN